MAQSSWSRTKGAWKATSSFGPRFSEEPSGLPLVRCHVCRQAYIIELTSKTDDHFGQKFFKCPLNVAGVKNTCSCFMWLSDYVEHLKMLGWIRPPAEDDSEPDLLHRSKNAVSSSVCRALGSTVEGKVAVLGRKMELLMWFNMACVVVFALLLWKK